MIVVDKIAIAGSMYAVEHDEMIDEFNDATDVHAQFGAALSR